MNKFSKLITKIKYRNFYTYDGGHNYDCKICNDIFFFVLGSYFGYIISKNKR